MTNLLNELVYISLGDARDTSDIFTSTVPSDATLTKLITQAQILIDTYIGYYDEPAVEWQSFIFPITWETEIPDDIKIATVWVTEQLYTLGTSIDKDKITSESNMSRRIDFSDKQSYNNYMESIWIPKRALNILNKYKNSFIWQVI